MACDAIVWIKVTICMEEVGHVTAEPATRKSWKELISE